MRHQRYIVMSWLPVVIGIENNVRSIKPENYQSNYFTNLEDAKQFAVIEQLKGRHIVIKDNKLHEIVYD